MRITGKALLDAVKHVLSIAGTTDLVQMRLKDSKLSVSAVGDRTYEYVIDADASKESFEFALPASAFVKNLKGNVEITVDRQVIISTASYKAELAFQPFIEPEFEKMGTHTTITPDKIYQIETSLSYIGINSIVGPVHYAVQIDESGFKACAFDRIHFGLYVNSSVKTRNPLALLVNVTDIQLLLSAMQSDSEGFTMSVHDGFVQARNSVSRLRMPLLQVSSNEGLPQVERLASTFGASTLTVIPGDLYDALDRARAIYDVTSNVLIESENGKLFISTTSATGRFKEVIAAQTRGPKISVPTDPNNIVDVLGRIYKEEQVFMGATQSFTFYKLKAEEANVTFGCFAKQGG